MKYLDSGFITVKQVPLHQEFPEPVNNRKEQADPCVDRPVRHGRSADLQPKLFPVAFLPVERHVEYELRVQQVCCKGRRQVRVLHQRNVYRLEDRRLIRLVFTAGTFINRLVYFIPDSLPGNDLHFVAKVFLSDVFQRPFTVGAVPEIFLYINDPLLYRKRFHDFFMSSPFLTGMLPDNYSTVILFDDLDSCFLFCFVEETEIGKAHLAFALPVLLAAGREKFLLKKCNLFLLVLDGKLKLIDLPAQFGDKGDIALLQSRDRPVEFLDHL